MALQVALFHSFSNFYFLATLHGMYDFSSLARDQTQVPCIGCAES